MPFDSNLCHKSTQIPFQSPDKRGASKRPGKAATPRDLKPKVAPKNEKEQLIAEGMTKGKNEYPTMDDVVSDWSSEDDDEGGKKKKQKRTKPNPEEKEKKSSKASTYL